MILVNEMSNEIYIEDIKASGTIITNSLSLFGETIKKGDSLKIRYQVVSPSYDYENNYIVLNLFNKSKDDYEKIKISWSIGDYTKVIPSNYVNGFYRVSQKYVKGNLYFTFYDYDEPNIIKILSLEMILRMKSNLRKQQRESEEKIKQQSGLSDNEISLIDYEMYNF